MIQARARYGSQGPALLAAMLESGAPVPEGLLEELWPVSLPYFDAFRCLNRGRQYGGNLQQTFPFGLAYSEVAAYAKDAGYHPDVSPWAFEEFVELVYAIDEAYLDTVHAKQATSTTASS